MNKSIRKVLGKERYELIKQRDVLFCYWDCCLFYGTYIDEEKVKNDLTDLNKKIETLTLLRKTLKSDNNGKENI